jgi:aminopeptidase N
LEPTWGMEYQLVLEEMYASLLSDSFETTHPVVDTVENPAGPAAVFDGLAYTKGKFNVKTPKSVKNLSKSEVKLNSSLS